MGHRSAVPLQVHLVGSPPPDYALVHFIVAPLAGGSLPFDGRVMFEFTVDATFAAARTGRLALPHGTVVTPCFMPVGTQGTVRALSPADLKAAGAQLVLANTYHLHVRPGEQVVERLPAPPPPAAGGGGGGSRA